MVGKEGIWKEKLNHYSWWIITMLLEPLIKRKVKQDTDNKKCRWEHKKHLLQFEPEGAEKYAHNWVGKVILWKKVQMNGNWLYKPIIIYRTSTCLKNIYFKLWDWKGSSNPDKKTELIKKKICLFQQKKWKIKANILTSQENWNNCGLWRRQLCSSFLEPLKYSQRALSEKEGWEELSEKEGWEELEIGGKSRQSEWTHS